MTILQSEAKVRLCCTKCRKRPCLSLKFSTVAVFSEISYVPSHCPLSLKDEMALSQALNALEEYEIAALCGNVRSTYNIGPSLCTGEGRKAALIVRIIRYSKGGLCSVLGRAADPGYRPWEFLRPWSVKDNAFKLPLHEEVEKEEAPSGGPSQIKGPMKITRVEWVHTDEQRKEESPEEVRDGDIIELRAEFENYEEGGSVSFVLYGNKDGSSKQLDKIDAKCSRRKSGVKWTVKSAELDFKKPGLVFYCEAKDQKSKNCPVEIKTPAPGGALIYVRDENSKLLEGVEAVLSANDKELLREQLDDGVLEIVNVVECDLMLECKMDGQKVKQKVRWNPGEPPYVAQIMTFPLDKAGA